MFCIYTSPNRALFLKQLINRWHGWTELLLLIHRRISATLALTGREFIRYENDPHSLLPFSIPPRVSIIPYQLDSSKPFPVNVLRNVAIRNVTTSHFFYNDIDFLPSGEVWWELWRCRKSLRRIDAHPWIFSSLSQDGTYRSCLWVPAKIEGLTAILLWINVRVSAISTNYKGEACIVHAFKHQELYRISRQIASACILRSTCILCRSTLSTNGLHHKTLSYTAFPVCMEIGKNRLTLWWLSPLAICSFIRRRICPCTTSDLWDTVGIRYSGLNTSVTLAIAFMCLTTGLLFTALTLSRIA